jgi:hypothetical protein
MHFDSGTWSFRYLHTWSSMYTSLWKSILYFIGLMMFNKENEMLHIFHASFVNIHIVFWFNVFSVNVHVFDATTTVNFGMKVSNQSCYTIYKAMDSESSSDSILLFIIHWTGDGQDLAFLICGLWQYSSWIKADNNSDLVAKFCVLLS